MNSTHPLDNPIWNSLCTEQGSLALGGALARRYPPAIGPLSGIPRQTAASYEALRELAGPEESLVLIIQEEPEIPVGWTVARRMELCQMICDAVPDLEPAVPGAGEVFRQLTADDVPEMVALARLTEPGPFRERTIELGTFYGMFAEGRLAAMAGKRMNLTGYQEVSAVCTHPDARGRSYARMAMLAVMREIFALGKTPFLHVLPENAGAIRIYERLGFRERRGLQLVVLKNAL